ncbi:EF-hand domain-containing protein [Salinarimonas ramus]|uniref:EF-hand domain-containing protein n=1 Tax=Salinarimonas ramus TaxID=690164 RepID=A0A917QK89_9HYPH|nr:hypothetical protein [Salinarimonas ramus]GGK54637.1 hypothetical protein GCM10011322_46770 [Salinarimonas ramus]
MLRKRTAFVVACSLAALALSVPPATAQTRAFEALDADGDGALGRAEFLAELEGREGLFETFDADADGALAPVEFRDGLYATWDRDDDGALSVSEWDRGVDAWFGEDDVELEVGQWDDDRNGTIEPEEFAEGLDETGLFAGLDASDDALLDDEELYGGVFDRADIDEDEELDEDEGGLLDVDFSLFGDA